jgi:hypothetical protein
MIDRTPRPLHALALLVLLLGVTLASSAARAVPRAGATGGIALAELHPGHGLAPFEAALDRIRDLGAPWVLVPVYGYVDSVDAPGVSADWEPPVSFAEYEAFVREVVAAARDRDLSVALVPYLNIRRADPADWRGTLAPPDWPAWFRSYAAFLDRWVDVARTERVGLLAVGAELVSSERHVEAWRRLIAHVRTRYDGRLFYSSNWDHYRETPFHDRLDVVGLSGYYSLPYDAPSSPVAIHRLWEEVRAELLLFGREVDRPLLFTEIGYPSIAGAARDPWNYLAEGAADTTEQALGLAAFTRAFRNEPWLEGVFFWNWSPFRGGPHDRSYSLRDKPAERIVRNWFQGPRFDRSYR